MLLLIFLSYSFAKEPKVVYKKETEIDFEGLEIEGELLKPSGAIISERKPAPFNPLIHLRTDFNIEMKQTVIDIK